MTTFLTTASKGAVGESNSQPSRLVCLLVRLYQCDRVLIYTGTRRLCLPRTMAAREWATTSIHNITRVVPVRFNVSERVFLKPCMKQS